MIYLTIERAIEIHRETIKNSGGGDYGQINIGYLASCLEHIQNDDYYPTFEDKLVHLIWSVNRNHSFSDGNKRLSITLGAAFLIVNGYMACLGRFMVEMENISYHLAAGRISKELLQKLIHSFLEGELDFDESLKLEYLEASANEQIGFAD
jgi:death-on-curing family protein